jgi:hypothetical protein
MGQRVQAGHVNHSSRRYPYTHKHNDASLDAILKHLAAADSVRVLRKAPKPDNDPCPMNLICTNK